MHDFFLRLAKAVALCGGAVLVGLVVMTCVSILGRAAADLLHGMVDSGILVTAATWLIDIGVGPISGDYELVEAGVAFSVFAFIPYCQITFGHAAVEVVTKALSPRIDRALRAITDVVFALVLGLIAVQLFAGLQSKYGSGQTTFLIQFPIWWAYAASWIGAVTATVVAVHIAIARIAGLLQNRDIIGTSAESDA